MAKIVNGSLVLDPTDHIDFVDNQGTSHVVYWDDLLERFLLDGDVEADQFVGATNSAVTNRNPQPNDDAYVVPTIWVNSTTNKSYILVSVSPGNAIWQLLAAEDDSEIKINHVITINDSVPPSGTLPFDMWITIDPI